MLQILRHDDVDPSLNPTGEILLSKEVIPYKVWVPDSKYLVLGNSQEPEKELRVAEVIRDRIPVYKRKSGGGAVLLSPGCLCVGLRFSKRKDLTIQDYFHLGSDLVRNLAGQAFGVQVECRGISDLVVGDRKVAGCALYMPKDYVLYLLSLLVDSDLSDIDKYLAHPSKEPDYRLGRSHKDFLVGLASFSTLPVTAQDLAAQFEKKIPVLLADHLDWQNK